VKGKDKDGKEVTQVKTLEDLTSSLRDSLIDIQKHQFKNASLIDYFDKVTHKLDEKIKKSKKVDQSTQTNDEDFKENDAVHEMENDYQQDILALKNDFKQ
jgi:hypothetical protein